MPPGEQFKRYYPGLIPRAADLWRWWLRDHETDFLRFDYNVFVGVGVVARPASLAGDPELADKMTAMWQRATQRKIDVVGYRASEVWVIEIENRPGMRALGQAVAYPHLLQPLLRDRRPINVGFVAEVMSDDMFTAFSGHGIKLWIRNPKPAQLPPPPVVPPVPIKPPHRHPPPHPGVPPYVPPGGKR